MAARRLLVVTGDFPVASETFIVAHVRGMIERGWTVAVAAGTIDAARVTELFGDKAPQTFALEAAAEAFRGRMGWLRRRALAKALGREWRARFPDSGGERMFSRAYALWQVARDFKPAAIHCEFGYQGPFAGPVAAALGVPMLVTYRGSDFIRFPVQHGWQIYHAFPARTVAIGHAEFALGILRRNLKVPVVHVRRGVNRASFSAPPRAAAWPATVRLITVGRMRFFKGHHLALEALALLRRMAPATRFELTVLGGDDPGFMGWRARVLGLADRLHLPGMLTPAQVGEQMRGSDIQLIPSCAGAEGFVENFCTVASEGQACGLPNVASNHGGIPETARYNGVLVPGGSALELARGVIEVMRADTPAGWAKRAQEASLRFQDDHMMDDFERVTLEAIGARHD